MAMEVRKITDFSQVEELYHFHMKKDFARRELRPLSSMRRLWEQGKYECFGLYEGEELYGYAGFYKDVANYLFDYLAVAEEHRSKGIGSIFIRELKNCIADATCILGEIEDPDKAKDEDERALRQRRQDFYERNGYLITEVTAQVFGEDYRLLEVPTGTEHSKAEIEEIYTDMYRDIFPKLIFKTCFQITSE